MKLKRRTLIRLILFAMAAIIILLIRNFALMKQNRSQQIMIRNGYMRALEDLSAAADNINNTLEKQLYAGTREQQAALANKLFNEASAAKTAMAQLPLQELNLENTYKFLSQVGNYAQSAAKSDDKESKPDNEEYKNLKALHEYSEKLKDKIWEIEQCVSSGEVELYSVSNNYTENEQPSMITEGFTEYEEGFTSYPRLIYDGPFSDHLMEKQPEMTKNSDGISKKKALEKASSILDISSNELTEIYEQEGKMPAWVFSDGKGSVSCAVTKDGGFVSYFIKSRQPNSADISVTEAVDKASEFLKGAGYGNMKVTYFEKSQNTVTVNFAYYVDEVTCYTDLIKVSVALDNGEILGFEAAGYITNHQKRQFPEKVISIKECEKHLSPYLKCTTRSKALIPTEGGKEAYCYEYKCKTEDGKNVLVYFNARTGEEEQILILIESEDGTLTM